MDNNTLQKLKDTLANHQKIAIAIGKNQTIDDMGAALALSLSLQASGKAITVASPTDPLVEVSSLVGINKMQKSLDAGGGDLIVSFPYTEGEIEKVSYTLENNYLNIIVKTSNKELAFTPEDVKYRTGGIAPTLLFVIGTPRLSDLGTVFNPEALKDVVIINIDNKADNQGFGDIVLVSPRFSSVSEQVASLLHTLQLPLEQDAAQNLLSGIDDGTESFQKATTSYLAFEMAAMLMKKGATRNKAKTQKPVQHAENNNAAQQFFGQMPQQPRKQHNQGQEPRQQINNQPASGQQRQAMPSMPFLRNTNNAPLAPREEKTKEPLQPQHQPQPQSQPQQENTPPDWLTPKVYKGSSLI